MQALPDPLSEGDLQTLKQHSLVISRAMDSELVYADWGAFTDTLAAAYDHVEPDRSGHVATYIPQLARVDPERFGVSACSVDGQQWGKGDNDVYFCLQSISKAVTYACILEDLGTAKVHQHIGREPSGVGFNERVLNSDGRPHNPCINSGAIMACSLFKPHLPMSDRFDSIMTTYERLCGGQKPMFGNATYLSERASANRNWCLGYMMQEENAFPPNTDLAQTLELYFMMCSIELTCDMLAIAAATFASGGVCPVTGERVFSEETVRNTLSLVASCGMYDGSGQFIFDVGFPAKSGVGGGLLIVIPGKVGLATFSPRLESHGNSLRGVRFCEHLASKLDFHQFSIERYAVGHGRSHQQLNNDLLVAAKARDIQYVKASLARGADVNYADYDKRTALHVAACEGFADVVHYLLAHGADTTAKDRYGATPHDDAVREKHADVAQLLAAPPTFKAGYKATTALPAAATESAACFAARLHAALDVDGSGAVRAQVLANTLRNVGYDSDNSKLLRPLFQALKDGDKPIGLDAFSDMLCKHSELGRAATNNVALADFREFEATLSKIFDEQRAVKTGTVASYVPTLAKANPDLWGAAVCSVSGQQILLGDYDTEWCVQATAKVVNYLIALDLLGEQKVHAHCGKEPSGRNFNQIWLDKHNLPHNPVVNAGAIMIVSLIKPDVSQADRFAYIKAQWKKLTGGTDVGFDNEMFLAESASSPRNWTLAYMMLDANAFPPNIKNNENLKDVLDLYFMCCSLTVTAQQMAIVTATLANGGVNPLTGERVFQKEHVRNALSIMSSCGLYDFSGEFQFNVGIPAKSGSSGGLLALQPGVFGVATFSPPLTKHGNSVRGINFLMGLAEKYAVHVYDPLARVKRNLTLHGGSSLQDRISDLLFAAGSGDLGGVRKQLAHGVSPNSVDYDNRSPLHVAAAEGHLAVCKILLAAGADVKLRDRWNATALDEATRNKHDETAKLLSDA